MFYIFIKEVLNDVIPVVPLDRDDDPLVPAEPNENPDTDVEDELDFDEESDEENIHINEFQIEQHFDPPNQNNLLCEVAEQANRGTLFPHSIF